MKNIKCFVKQVTEYNNALVLLHKDARFDMDELDKAYGPMGWKDSYEEIGGNLYCTISVWDEKKAQWISKTDVGAETHIEREKGQASDAFKRAGVKWGIGRFLYTAPDIWIKLSDDEVYMRNGVRYSKVVFVATKVNVDDGLITSIEIQDQDGRVRFTWGSDELPVVPDEPAVEELREIAREKVELSSQSEEWKEKVRKGLERYDIGTIKRLLASPQLKGV